MQAGRLDRRITIEEVTESQDSYGAISETWSVFVVVNAAVQPMRGREFFKDDQRAADIDTVFRIRYLAGVHYKMRIKYDGKTYDIYSVAETGRRDGLEIAAKARVE